MAKLKLQVEDLAVESFQPAAEAPARGTVVAESARASQETACPEYSCVVNSQCCQSQDPTCLFSCPQGCTGGVSADCYPTQVC
jgi:hypothetical protein